MDMINVDLDRIDSTQLFPLGAVYNDGVGNEYRYVKYNSGAGTVTGVAGYLALHVGTGTTGMTQWEVTCDYESNAAGTAITCPNAAAGFLQAALTDGNFGWVQTRGVSRKDMLTDGNVDANERLMVSATDGGVLPFADAAPPLATLGVALYADDGTSLDAGNALIDIRY